MPEQEKYINRFIILAAPRSGSNYLASLLNSHPAILCHHELFNPKGIRLALNLRHREPEYGSMVDRDRKPVKFLSRIWSDPQGHQSIGFKMTLWQNRLALDALIKDKEVKKVILSRKNQLKTIISHQISDALGEWEVYDRNQLAQNRPRIKFRPGDFHERIALYKEYYDEIESRLQKSEQEAFYIHYEQLSDPTILSQLLAFLDVTPVNQELITPSIKQNSTNIRDLVVNFDEMEALFKGTEFEKDLLSLED